MVSCYVLRRVTVHVGPVMVDKGFGGAGGSDILMQSTFHMIVMEVAV